MNGSPVRPARSRRNASNICFQAAACTRAVCVRTPSRSNRQARIPLGKPSRWALSSTDETVVDSGSCVVDSGSCVGTKGDPSEASAGWRSWRLCRRDSLDPVCVAEGGPIRNGDPRVAVSFAEPISLSSTVLVDLRLPPTALGLGFVLLALRARRARESRCERVPAQEVPKQKCRNLEARLFVGLCTPRRPTGAPGLLARLATQPRL